MVIKNRFFSVTLIILVIVGILLTVSFIRQQTSTSSKAAETGIFSSPDASGFSASVTVTQPPEEIKISRFIWGANYFTFAFDQSKPVRAPFPWDEAKAKELGVKMIRFMGGIPGDFYNPNTALMDYTLNGTRITRTVWTIDDALETARKVGGELLFQVNVETKNKHPHPEGVGFVPHNYEEIVDDEVRKQRMIQDAVGVLRKYKNTATPIKYFELGNESWGNGWAPQEYVDVVREFADALKREDPTITTFLVGHPTYSNTTNDNTIDHPSNIEWTRVMNAVKNDKCGVAQEKLCFDYITDHPYHYVGYDHFMANKYPVSQEKVTANFPGMSAYYPLTEGSAFRQYDKKTTDYGKPPALTEWNLVCWNDDLKTPLTIVNNNFSTIDLKDWYFWPWQGGSKTKGRMEVEKVSNNNALKLTITGKSGDTSPTFAGDVVQALQGQISVKPNTRYRLTARVKALKPGQARIGIQADNPGVNQYKTIAYSTVPVLDSDVWQTLSITGVTLSDTSTIQVVMRMLKTNDDWAEEPGEESVYFDDVQLYEILPGNTSPVPSIRTAEQGFFVFESLMQQATHKIPFSIYHGLDNGPCGFFLNATTFNPQGEAFALTSVIGDGSLLLPQVTSPNFQTPPNPTCPNTPLDCIPGGLSLPFISAYSAQSKDKKTTYVYIANRHLSKFGNVNIDLSNIEENSRHTVNAKILKAQRFTDLKFEVSDQSKLVNGNSLLINVPPVSIIRLTITDDLLGDINSDKNIDILDFEIWKCEYLQDSRSPCIAPRAQIRDGKNTADLDNNSLIDLLDFSTWRISAASGL